MRFKLQFLCCTTIGHLVLSWATVVRSGYLIWRGVLLQ
jgi:hypothetical protein